MKKCERRRSKMAGRIVARLLWVQVFTAIAFTTAGVSSPSSSSMPRWGRCAMGGANRGSGSGAREFGSWHEGAAQRQVSPRHCQPLSHTEACARCRNLSLGRMRQPPPGTHRGVATRSNHFTSEGSVGAEGMFESSAFPDAALGACRGGGGGMEDEDSDVPRGASPAAELLARREDARAPRSVGQHAAAARVPRTRHAPAALASRIPSVLGEAGVDGWVLGTAGEEKREEEGRGGDGGDARERRETSHAGEERREEERGGEGARGGREKLGTVRKGYGGDGGGAKRGRWVGPAAAWVDPKP